MSSVMRIRGRAGDQAAVHQVLRQQDLALSAVWTSINEMRSSGDHPFPAPIPLTLARVKESRRDELPAIRLQVHATSPLCDVENRELPGRLDPTAN
jgi:hypothetical protein